ncbi:histone-lysine N-methyltransferase isoform X2 [Wolffia australiana]
MWDGGLDQYRVVALPDATNSEFSVREAGLQICTVGSGVDCDSNVMNASEEHSMGVHTLSTNAALKSCPPIENHAALNDVKNCVEIYARKTFSAGINGLSRPGNSSNEASSQSSTEVCTESSKEIAVVQLCPNGKDDVLVSCGTEGNDVAYNTSEEPVQILLKVDELTREGAGTVFLNDNEKKPQIFNSVDRETDVMLEDFNKEVPQALPVEDVSDEGLDVETAISNDDEENPQIFSSVDRETDVKLEDFNKEVPQALPVEDVSDEGLDVETVISNEDEKNLQIFSALDKETDGLLEESNKEVPQALPIEDVSDEGLDVETVISNEDEKNLQIFSALDKETDGLLEESNKEVPQALPIEDISCEGLGLGDMALKKVSEESSSLPSSNICVNFDPLPFTERRRNPARTASSRNTQLTTLIGKAPKPRKLKKKSNSAPKIRVSLMEVLRISSRVVTKKRCRSLKKARLSVWGALPNIFDLFKVSEKPCQLKRKELKRGMCQKKKGGKSLAPAVNEAISVKPETFFQNFLAPDQCSPVNQRSTCQTVSKLEANEQGDETKVPELESSLTQENSGENIASDCLGTRFQGAKGESVESFSERLLLDAGNRSPDSGVVHPTVDDGNAKGECVVLNDIKSKDGTFGYHICESRSPAQENFHADAATSVSPRCVQLQTESKRDKRVANAKTGENGCSLSGYSSEGTSTMPSDLRKNKKPSRKSLGLKKKGRPAAKKTRNCQRIKDDGSTAVEKPHLLCKVRFSPENSSFSAVDPTIVNKGCNMLQNLPSCSSSQQQSLKVDFADARTQKGAIGKKSGSKKSAGKRRSNKKIPHVLSAITVESLAHVAHQEQRKNNSQLNSELNIRISEGNPDGASGGNNEVLAAESNRGSESQTLRDRAAWVCCDDCHKWRSIAVELADAIDEKGCRWTCKDNKDKGFADCSVPQAKSNAEINAELEISDDSCEEDVYKEKRFALVSDLKPSAFQQSAWVQIKTNVFLHRARKLQTIDEVMVCQCKPPQDGSMGCGDECLNRMLNIECTPETCPCGNLCSNQQFQKREYAKFKYFRCGKKGFGLRLLEDARQGQFLIEYVGEVLDMVGYEARQREYAFRGQKHFYFMTLNGNEVIDACAKGNLGRFINHSCDPNCRTEKWMINGEVCVGLFATRDLKKGEEVTFDYNYVRVFGAAAKKCLCSSTNCRGYIGGDPSNEVLIQSDSDEEHPEPVMIAENGDLNIEVEEANSESDHLIEEKVQTGDNVDPTVDLSSLVNDNVVLRVSLQQSSEKDMTSVSKDSEKPSSSKITADLKSSRVSSGVKKGRLKTKKYVAHKEKTTLVVSQSQQEVYQSVHEGVEEKLNELLDSRGGIKKQRDATKGYLKLLFFSATSGDDMKSEASQSTRDLSLILDALLKTKSRTVLVDVVNKNGLQMLHNIMKQNRRNFNKIPVIRKLLKCSYMWESYM